jgi:NADPH2 dehydrogenase
LNRFSGYQFQNGLTTPNRVIVPPMASETASLNGEVTEKTISHYERLAASGAGIVMVEYSYVHASGKSEEHQLAIDQDEQILGLAKIAKVIQATGAIAGIQLTHSGGKSTQVFTQNQLMGPSAIAVPVKERDMEVPHAMTVQEIQLWKDSFFTAAARAAAAGFNLVELHAAHGYGINQWLSPITNQRTDQYGGSFENRLRLLLEIFESIRTAFPHLLLSVRIPGQDLYEEGLLLTDSVEIAKQLEARHIDLIHVSSGIGGWRRPKEREGEGYLVPEAEQIQKQLAIPVIGVGGIQTANYIDQLLEKKSVSFVAVGRAILTDPFLWKSTVLNKSG